MTRLGRLLRNLLERILARYHEGPEPPRRLAEEVRLFRVYYPRATPEQWAQFATTIAQNSYRSGFTRGYEWQERGWEGPPIEPEVLAEIQAHDWSLADMSPRVAGMLEAGADEFDPLRRMSPEQRAVYLDHLGELAGTHRITIEYDDEDSD
jgi:hypothetical protein